MSEINTNAPLSIVDQILEIKNHISDLEFLSQEVEKAKVDRFLAKEPDSEAVGWLDGLAKGFENRCQAEVSKNQSVDPKARCIDFLLEQFYENPTKENAEKIRRVTGYFPPDILDDFDETTTFDAETRTKVRNAILKLEEVLLAQGLDPNSKSPEVRSVWESSMASGLYAFVAARRDMSEEMRLLDVVPAELSSDSQMRSQSTQILLDEGLESFIPYLLENGGLNVSMFPNEGPNGENRDASIEASALEALKFGRGYCTERSYILKAVFRMAGLKVFDASAPRHLYVGLQMQNGMKQYLDLGMYSSHRSSEGAQLSLSEGFSIYLRNSRIDFKEKNVRIEEVSEIIDLNLWLAPNLETTYEDAATKYNQLNDPPSGLGSKMLFCLENFLSFDENHERTVYLLQKLLRKNPNHKFKKKWVDFYSR